MRTLKSLLIIASALLFFISGTLAAQDNRYNNIQQATHISGGWVAYSNGELYRCSFAASNNAPSCALASGLPSDLQSVSVLWADGDKAWAAYTDGQVYGCHSQHKKPVCLPATGLP